MGIKNNFFPKEQSGTGTAAGGGGGHRPGGAQSCGMRAVGSVG